MGRLPQWKSFRGLLGVHACSGLPARRVAYATLSIRGFGKIVTFPTAPIATGWSNSCPVGLAPTEERHLCTAHGHARYLETRAPVTKAVGATGLAFDLPIRLAFVQRRALRPAFV